jgi:hypothetical protein
MTVRDHLKNRTLITDLGLLIKNTDKIFKLINLRTLFQKEEKEPEHISAIKEEQAIKEININKSFVLYVNGMLTSETDAINQQNALSKTLNQSVGVFYNKTGGLIIDLIETSYGRNLEKSSEAAKNVAASIIDKVNNTNQTLTLIGYSQGAVIFNNALQIAQKELTDRQLNKIKFITFGGALNECDLNDNIEIEHFVNLDDPVPHLGLLIEDKTHSGTIYKRDAAGHFFLDDYLEPFKNGEFGTNSNFYKSIGKKELEQDLTKFMSKYEEINKQINKKINYKNT